MNLRVLCSIAVLVSAFAFTTTAAEPGVLTFPAEGSSQGKIVLVSGDEEYRTEESMPMLAKILSKHHHFDCTVLFSMSEDGTYIDPNHSAGVQGWEELDDADLMIIGTRFRKPNESDAEHITKFVNDGKPLIGIRTATHAFNGKGSFGESLSYGKFGLKILGEEWVSHHGRHKTQGARGVVVPEHADHPILTTVGEIFAPSDVYGVKHLTDQDTILLRGAVTESLDPTSANITGPKNDPMQPLAWLHPYQSPAGTKGQSFCTTAGASVDLADKDLRRLLVNAAYFLTGKEVPKNANVDYVDPFYPTFYGFIREKNYFKRLGMKPSDFGLGKSPAFDDPKGSPTWSFRDRPDTVTQ